MNEKIDAFEVNDRIKQLKNRTFTEQEIEKIANAYVEFNKYIASYKGILMNGNCNDLYYKVMVNKNDRKIL